MSGTAAVNINLDGVKNEIASIKHETDAIQETLKDHGEQLVDIKVGLICWLVSHCPLTLRLVERPGGGAEEHY